MSQETDSTLVIGIDGDTKEFERTLSGLDKVGTSVLKKLSTGISKLSIDFKSVSVSSLNLANDLQGVQNEIDVLNKKKISIPVVNIANPILSQNDSVGPTKPTNSLEKEKETGTFVEEKIISLIEGAFKALGDSTDEVPNIISDVLGKALNEEDVELDTMFKDIGNSMAQSLTDSMLGGTQGLIKEVLSSIGEEGSFTNDFFSALGDSTGDVPNIISDVVGKALDGETVKLDTMFEDIGKNMVKSLADSMLDMSQGYLKDALSGIASFVVTFTKGLFGIASPSKVFAEFGYENMRGLAQGMSKNQNLVQNSISGLRGVIDKELGIIEPSVKPLFDLQAIKSQFSMSNMFGTPQLAFLGGGFGGFAASAGSAGSNGRFGNGGINITVTNINNAQGTSVETRQSKKPNGDIEIVNTIIAVVSNNINQGGQIKQSIDHAGQNKISR